MLNNNRFKNKLKSSKYFNNILIKIVSKRKDINNYNIIKNNLFKYNITKNNLNICLVNNLIENKACHFKAYLKENNIFNNNKIEYLKGYYKYNEIIHKFNKFYLYYKNYFKFFLKPTITDFDFLEILKKNGNHQAQFFYEKYNHKNNNNKLNNNNINNTKKILLSNIIEKNNNNISSISYSYENNNSKNSSSISLLSIINLINNNKTKDIQENNENDFFKNKINLFLNYNNKKNKNIIQRSTTALTPQSKTSNDINKFQKFNNIKIINNYKNEKNESNIKYNIKTKNNLIKNNVIDNIMCLSARSNIEKISKKYFKDKIIKNNNNNTTAKTNINTNNINIKTSFRQNTPSNLMNYNLKIYYNLKQTYKPIINLEKLFNSNYNSQINSYLSSTQIKKVIKNKPFFRNPNNINNINNVNYKNVSISNNNKSSYFKNYLFRNKNRNDINGDSFIYYQKLKKGL